MPYSLVLHCVPPMAHYAPKTARAKKALALFLQELIEKQDAVVAARLHAPKNSKPFTTAIMPRPVSSGNSYRRQSVEESAEVKLRLTLLDDTLYPLVSQFFLQHLDGIPLLRLGQTPLLVSRVLATPESGEPWAGFARFADIAGSRVDIRNLLDSAVRHPHVIQGWRCRTPPAHAAPVLSELAQQLG